MLMKFQSPPKIFVRSTSSSCFSHADLTKLGVRLVNSTVDLVDLTNSWENYLVLSVDLTKNYSRYVYQREDLNPPVDLTNFANVELVFPLQA